MPVIESLQMPPFCQTSQKNRPVVAHVVASSRTVMVVTLLNCIKRRLCTVISRQKYRWALYPYVRVYGSRHCPIWSRRNNLTGRLPPVSDSQVTAVYGCMTGLMLEVMQSRTRRRRKGPRWDAECFFYFRYMSSLDVSDSDICHAHHVISLACDFDFFIFTLRSLHGRSLYEYLYCRLFSSPNLSLPHSQTEVSIT